MNIAFKLSSGAAVPYFGCLLLMKTSHISVIVFFMSIATLAAAKMQPVASINEMSMYAYKACSARRIEIQASETLRSVLSEATKTNLCSCMETQTKTNAAIRNLYRPHISSSDYDQRLMAVPEFKELYDARAQLSYQQCIAPDIDAALTSAITKVPLIKP